MSLFEDLNGARFSPCMKYRYALWRIWDASKPALVFVMLNPSTADLYKNDPTVERCQRRAVQMGFGGLRVANIFAFRSTDPNPLYDLDDPVGPENDAAIVEAAKLGGLVVCGWGTHGNLHKRGQQVIGLLQRNGIKPHYLKLNADKTPAHPLYIGYEVTPQPFPEISAE